MALQGFVPLYQRLFNHYREKIITQEYSAGDRIDSITRIMERHNVSRETAKIVLSKLNEEGYIIKKSGKGSFVTYARELEKAWGIMVPFMSSNIEDLIGHLFLEAQKINREIRYVLHYNEPEEEMRQVGSMIRNGYEAIMIVPNYDESLTADFYRKLNAGNTMMVLLDNTMVGSFFNYAIQSYDLGVKRAYNYLSVQNDKNLLFVKDETWRGKNLVHELMEQSLQHFIARQSPGRKLFTVSGLRNLDHQYFVSKNIGGVLCCTDTDAVRLTGRLISYKMKIPGEVSLVCYGNTELTMAGSVPLTVIDCKYPEMARTAASLVFCKDCSRQTQQFVIEPELVIRGT